MTSLINFCSRPQTPGSHEYNGRLVKCKFWSFEAGFTLRFTQYDLFSRIYACENAVNVTKRARVRHLENTKTLELHTVQTSLFISSSTMLDNYD